MLKHDDTPQAPPQTAAKVRVTPEELAAAVTALQIRKEGQPGTIAIGDAVEELGLDVTPEEVLAEVQARRAKPKRRRDYRALACAGACLVMLASLGVLHHSNDTAPVHAMLLQTETLAEAGDNQQVYVDMHGLKQLIGGEAQSQVKIYRALTPQYATEDWGVIKHNGQVYVQGYTAQTRTELASQPITLDNCEDHYGPNRTGFITPAGQFYPVLKITLPVKGLDSPNFVQTSQESLMALSGVRSDSHLGDAFPDHFIQ